MLLPYFWSPKKKDFPSKPLAFICLSPKVSPAPPCRSDSPRPGGPLLHPVAAATTATSPSVGVGLWRLKAVRDWVGTSV